MFYLDASACVALLTPEIGTARMNNWLDTNAADRLATSPWVHTEVCSALSIKVRTGSLSPDRRNQTLAAWLELREGLRELPVEEARFAGAAEMLGRHDLPLRAGDALHLAVAAAHNCTLVTLDDRMAKAALELGVPVAEL